MLQDVSLHIAPGETIAFVGSSGGGKTTLSQLIPRFYDVTSGSISIDGTDVKSNTGISAQKYWSCAAGGISFCGQHCRKHPIWKAGCNDG